ncbi:MAG: hypothetical protein LUI12_01830 [Clostridiales bacterium]|nr:hypothetical protein [Clostridiales bacterium]
MNTFKINEKEYNARAFDFNMLCDLEDMGISLEQAQNKPMSMVRAYFGLCAGKGKEYAGNEMEAHIVGGGKFDDIMNAMTKEMGESDFFRNLSKTAEEETATDEREKKQEN